MHEEDVRSRAIAFERELLRAVATEVVALPFGEGVLTADLPAVWDHNLVVVDAGQHPDPQLVASHADDLLAGIGAGHRKVRYDSVDAAADADAFFAAAGYEHHRLVLLAWSDVRPSWPEAARVLSPPETDDVTRRFTAVRPWGNDPEKVAMFVELSRRTLAATGGRMVGVVVDGQVQAAVRVYGTGPVRQIENLEVLEAYRGSGLGRAVLLAGLHEAMRGDPHLVFVVAEEDDWTWGWYQRLGFRALGRIAVFDRDA